MSHQLVPNKNSDDHLYFFTLSILTTTFFTWGFLASFNDILIPHLKNIFNLSYSKAMLIQFCFFIAYFFVSIPAGKIVKRIGYKNGIVTGLIIAACGCLCFYPAAEFELYFLFLLALFILASGITFLQVSANPYATTIGKPATASSRLTLMQGFNSLGTTTGPIVGSIVIFTSLDMSQSADASVVQLPYLTLSFVLFCLALIFKRLKLKEMRSDTINLEKIIRENRQKIPPHTYYAVLGIFCYVGAEITIASLLISYLAEPFILDVSHSVAARYLSIYFAGAMIGRFFGAYIMRYVQPHLMLIINALLAIMLIATSISFSGQISAMTMLAVGICNSIMFPTIFSLGLKGLKSSTSQGSGLLCLGIVGGGIIPLIQGMFADKYGLQLSFIVPLCCYIYIGYFAILCKKLQHIE